MTESFIHQPLAFTCTNIQTIYYVQVYLLTSDSTMFSWFIAPVTFLWSENSLFLFLCLSTMQMKERARDVNFSGSFLLSDGIASHLLPWCKMPPRFLRPHKLNMQLQERAHGIPASLAIQQPITWSNHTPHSHPSLYSLLTPANCQVQVRVHFAIHRAFRPG